MSFSQIEIHQWQQIEKVDINLDRRLTILTGANGSGKTTILTMLAKHCNWEKNQLSVPKIDKSNGIVKFFTRFFHGSNKINDNNIGQIKYSNGTISEITIPIGDIQSYNISIANMQQVNCLYIPAHRSVFRYEMMNSIPMTKKDRKSAYDEVANVERNTYSGCSGQSISYYMKSTLIGWAVNGYGVKKGEKNIMPSDSEQIANFEGFQDVLRKVLPKTLGFNELEIRNMEIVFVCNNGNDEFLLESVSGGISAIIDLAWQVYMYNVDNKTEFTVIVDEIENHLHPTLQRSILSDFMNAFPNAHFIVSTHSPLIVSSVRDAGVYVLKYNNEKKVVSSELDILHNPKTANEILNEVLGLSTTYPVWVEEAYDAIIKKFEESNVTPSSINELKSNLASIGMGNIFIDTLAERKIK